MAASAAFALWSNSLRAGGASGLLPIRVESAMIYYRAARAQERRGGGKEGRREGAGCCWPDDHATINGYGTNSRRVAR